MATPSAVEDLRRLGYEVEQSHPGTDGSPPVYYVAGYGIGTHVRADDEEAWASLLDPEAHAEVVRQSEETEEETFERLAREAK